MPTKFGCFSKDDKTMQLRESKKAPRKGKRRMAIDRVSTSGYRPLTSGGARRYVSG
jgi:hypothetical protein